MATAGLTTQRCFAITARCRLSSIGMARRGFCIEPLAVTPELASFSSHGRQQINAEAIGQDQNVTSVLGGEGCFPSSSLNGAWQWHVLNLK